MFLIIVLVPSALLVVFGWRLMRHEAEQERQARREQMASEVVAMLQQRVHEIDTRLRERRMEATVASNRDDFVCAVFSPGRIATTPARRLLYYPITATGREAPVPEIGEAMTLRRLGRTDAALAALTRAAAVQDASVAGIPVDLFARWAECDLLAEVGRTDESASTARTCGTWTFRRMALASHSQWDHAIGRKSGPSKTRPRQSNQGFVADERGPT